MSRSGWVVAVAATLVMLPGCRKKNQAPPEERGSIFSDATMSGPADPRYGSQGKRIVKTVEVTKNGDKTSSAEKPVTSERTYKNCKLLEVVTKGDPATAEGTLYNVFKALLIQGEEASFQAFLSHVDPNYQRPDHVRRYWFKAARKDGGKYFHRLVYGPNDPTYVICERRPEGKATRIFVGKSPPVGSNPPFVLHQVDGKWLLKSFTPH